MVLVIAVDIRQVAHSLFGLSHIRKRVFHPTILPFADVNHLGHFLLYHQQFYLPVLQLRVQLLHCCHATPILCQDPALCVNGRFGVDMDVKGVAASLFDPIAKCRQTSRSEG